MFRNFPWTCSWLFALCSDVHHRSRPRTDGTKGGEWRTYGGDLGSTRYAPLDQINADNFGKLQVAWRFKTDVFGIRPDFNLQTTPLMINGVLVCDGRLTGATPSRSMPRPANCCGCTGSMKASVRLQHHACCPGAESRTGPMGKATSAFSW